MTPEERKPYTRENIEEARRRLQERVSDRVSRGEPIPIHDQREARVLATVDALRAEVEGLKDRLTPERVSAALTAVVARAEKAESEAASLRERVAAVDRPMPCGHPLRAERCGRCGEYRTDAHGSGEADGDGYEIQCGPPYCAGCRLDELEASRVDFAAATAKVEELRKTLKKIVDFGCTGIGSPPSCACRTCIAWRALSTPATTEGGRREVLVEGRMMLRTHLEFERACEVILADEQEKPSPDSHLVGVLCDAIRLSREACDMARRPI